MNDITCDMCSQSCDEGYGNKEFAVACCICAQRDFPVLIEPCDTCAMRVMELAI